MGAEIINLRQARKKRERAQREARASHNRVASGRTKAEREAAREIDRQAQRRLDGHQLGEIKDEREDGAPS